MIYQKSNSQTQNYFQCIRYTDFHYIPHMHRNPELIYVREGEIIVKTELGTEIVSKGEFALVFPNRIHEYETKESSLVDVCIFSEDHVPYFVSKTRGKSPVKCKFTSRDSVKEFVGKELFVSSYLPELCIRKGALYLVLGEYLKECAPVKKDIKNEALIDKIIEYIENNFREPITLKSMAEALGYEHHYISRFFHSRIPMHFSRYVNLYRVDMANSLLHATSLSMTDIAMQSGFQSIRSFNRVFLELAGIPPSEVREKNDEPFHLVLE